jgi:hypothetical protein
MTYRKLDNPVIIIWQVSDNNLAITDGKKFSKHINMRSSFEDFIATKPMVKTNFYSD